MKPQWRLKLQWQQLEPNRLQIYCWYPLSLDKMIYDENTAWVKRREGQDSFWFCD